jgi:hypothetical protein
VNESRGQVTDAGWHLRQEDIVRALQQLRSPDAIDVLERAAFSIYAHLAYDENFGLARNCTWALADIGTPEAQQALTRLASCDNAVIAARYFGSSYSHFASDNLLDRDEFCQGSIFD